MSAPIRRWLAEPLGGEVEASLGRLASAGDAAHVAVMPDAHLAHDVCIGTVFATRETLYPSAVGGDIGCGVATVRLDTEAARLGDERVAARVLSGLYSRVPFLKHRAAPPLPDALATVPLSAPRLERRKHREGRLQLGTLGRGNHFLELQSDDEDRLWVMVHSGSRSMGVAIRDHHMATAPRDAASRLLFIHAESDAGRAYLADHSWALAYAARNRDLLIERTAEVLSDVLGASPVESARVSCHHNHVRAEEHFGETLLVHRKGAISAVDGEPGLIPGSMGTPSFHTAGRGCADALSSSSHGAGRVMSRTEARRRISRRDLRRRMVGVWYDHRRERQLLDEAPDAYRDITAVMRAQRDLTRILRRVRPVLSFKGA